MTIKLCLSTAATSILLLGCTPQDTSPSAAAGATAAGRQCFRAQDVNGFTPVDRDTVDVQVSASRVYRLELFNDCPDINWSRGIAMRSRGSSWICTGSDLGTELIVPDAIGTGRCLVRDVRRLSNAEIEASRSHRN
jgi:hypothetical protein